MAPYLRIPQTPGAKSQFDDLVDDLGSASSITSRPPSPSANTEDEAKHARLKAPSPSPQQQQQPPANRLGPPDDVLYRISIGSMSDAGYGPSLSPLMAAHDADPPHPPPGRPPGGPPLPAWLQRIPVPPFLAAVWDRNRAVFLVFFAQLFGALMNLFARLLELEGGGPGREHGFHPIQLLFVRMVATTVASCIYMYRYRVPYFPLGPPGVRSLLVVRGLTGFFGIFGMWYSMMYLPLAEATVFSFLSPSVTGYICHLLLNDPFARTEQIASVVALLGVVLITRPLSFIGGGAGSGDDTVTAIGDGGIDGGLVDAIVNGTVSAVVRALSNATAEAPAMAPADSDHVSTGQRLLAVAVALLGVLGSSSAFTTIRAIGTRAHPLISVNYFSTWCTIVSATVLAIAPALNIGQPQLRFALPHGLHQWFLLLLICICGFCTQLLATTGLGLERSNRATAMVYTQMLFAAGFDRFVFGHQMGPTSLGGCGLIIGSALWAALSKKPTQPKPTTEQTGGGGESPSAAAADIEIGILETAAQRPRHSRDRADFGPSGAAGEEGVPMLAATDSDNDDDDKEAEDETTQLDYRGRRSRELEV